MNKLALHVERFVREEDGPTVVEYAVMLSLIVLAAVASIVALGSKVNESFSTLAEGLPE
ncbi:MAG: Flp family type IVb pilin [Phycisphaerae bacterium]|nr:Flp family type IVb pilin [Phycisphaerae bacterium]